MSERDKSFVSASQIRGARGILNWSQDDLAAACKLSVATIRKLELGHISPRVATTETIRQALEDAGLEFVEPNGVRQRPEDITIYQGPEGARDFYDDVYMTAKNKGGETVIIHPSAKKYFVDTIGEHSKIHLDRMTTLKNLISVKCLVTEDRDILPAVAYCEYRFISKNYVNAAPSYVYDDKYALIIPEAVPSPKIVVIRSRAVAETFRHQFYSMWEKATPLNAMEKTPLKTQKTKAST